MAFPPAVGAECFRPNASTNTPFGVLSGAFNAPLSGRKRDLSLSLTAMRLNLPDNTRKGVFVDAFGRKHSAPTVDDTLSLTTMELNPPAS